MKKLYIFILLICFLVTYNINSLAVSFTGPVDYQSIISNSDYIFVGFITGSKVFKNDVNVIKTDWQVTPYLDLKGNAKNSLTVRTVGGKYENNITMGTQLQERTKMYIFFMKKKDDYLLPVKSSVSIEPIDSLSFNKGLNIKISNEKLYKPLRAFFENISQVSLICEKGEILNEN